MSRYDESVERLLAEEFATSKDPEFRKEYADRLDRLRRADEVEESGDRFGRVEGFLRVEGLLDEEGSS